MKRWFKGTGIRPIIFYTHRHGRVRWLGNEKRKRASVDTAIPDLPARSSTAPAPRVDIAGDLDEKLAALIARDPVFNRQMFEDKVSTSFFKIQKAWCARDMDSARAYISESVVKRYNMQLESYRTSNTFNRLEDLSLDKVEIANIHSDDRFDTIDVAITATARDYKVNDKGEHVSGSKELETWDEMWSMIRSVSVVTEEAKDIHSDNCPSCGAPLSVNASGVCEYCETNVTKGDFDWVLAEITQLNL